MTFFIKRFLPGLLLAVLVQSALAHTADAAGKRTVFSPLAHRLIADGFDAKKISKLYGSGKVRFDTEGMLLFFRHNEATLDYHQFLSRKNLRAAQRYLKAHQRVFAETQKKFGVNRQVITAIILVETKLGRYLGDRSILDTLSSMASLAQPRIRRRFWSEITRHHWLSRKHFELKVKRRSAWAYGELTAFLTFSFREKLDPTQALGSIAGAMGICQFMPSNLLVYGRDGNGDGSVNPYTHADAIASIACYLEHFGWHPGIGRKAAYQVLMHYNHSSYYVTTVLRLAAKLKG